MSGKQRVCTADGCDRTPVGRRLCRSHYQAAWKAGELGKHDTVPQRKRRPDAQVCPDTHKHAENSTCFIQHHCTCTPCNDANNARAGRRRRLHAYGKFDTGLVDAEPVREHLLMLGEFGLGYKRVAGLAGIGITPVRNIIWGRQDPGPRKGEIPKRIKRENAAAILAVKPDLNALAPGKPIPSRGTHRRLQALVARGWSLSKLGARVGMDPSNISTLMKRDLVTVATHMAVARMYDELWDQQPPRAAWHDAAAFSRSIIFARARRWLPPLAWDDIDNDAEPPAPDDDADGIDDMAVELAMTGERVRLTPAERREAVTRLHSALWSDTRIAETLHCADRTVLRIRQELGLEAIELTDQVQKGSAA